MRRRRGGGGGGGEGGEGVHTYPELYTAVAVLVFSESIIQIFWMIRKSNLHFQKLLNELVKVTYFSNFQLGKVSSFLGNVYP